MINRLSTLDISRRRLLGAATLGAGALIAAAAAGPALADSKFNQKMAKYQPTPKGAQSCNNCSQFQAPNGCKVVASPVAASGWCLLYAAK